ncbi:MAG: TlyA family RNA methyltransferase [Spirochaetes bacterium]|nr:TlyA family RNA methyltransferase [Spirochaetota bacterium]
MKNKKRLDILLHEKGYFSSRSQSHQYILAGKVFINETREDKPGKLFPVDKIKTVYIKQSPRYVSRGGYKLEKALKEFSVNPSGKICLDIGASTGGFTDCLLQKKAKKVYAVDVGYGQIDMKLRRDPRLVLLEKTNIRYITEKQFDEKIELVTCDVSFISVQKFLHRLAAFLSENFDMIVLVKPQFESSIKEVKKGVIKDPLVHAKVLRSFQDYILSINLKIINWTFSPLKGPKGNIEYLAHITKAAPQKAPDIEVIVNMAHTSLKKEISKEESGK